MIDLKQQLIGFDGKPVPARNGILTVKVACNDALLAPDNTDTEDKKMQKYHLAKKVNEHKEDKIKLKPEDIVLIKRSAGKIYAPLPLGLLFEILDK